MSGTVPNQDDANHRSVETFLRDHCEPLTRPKKDTTCVICLGNFLTGNNVGRQALLRLKKCGHEFHMTCWTNWFAERSPNANKCPTCRDVLFELPEEDIVILGIECDHRKDVHVLRNNPFVPLPDEEPLDFADRLCARFNVQPAQLVEIKREINRCIALRQQRD